MNPQTRLLRAHNRKRKPPHYMTEKRRVVKMTWDVNSRDTESLHRELGVSMLPDSADECEADSKQAQHQPADICYPSVESQLTVVPSLAHVQTLGPCGVYLSQLSPPCRHIDSSWPSKPLSSPLHSTTDNWTTLSDEILLQVLQWLPKAGLMRCLRVCKRWNRLGLDETLWRRIDLSSKTLRQGELGTVLDRGVTVLRLARSDIHAPIYRHVQLYQEQRFSKVQFLDLSMSAASAAVLQQVVSTCHRLRKLSLENCQINNGVCRAIGQNRHLEVLNLSMCEAITENDLVPICNNLQKLDTLNIGWTSLSRGAVLYLVICLSPTLTKLNLAGCRDTLEDDDIQQLCSSCPNLKELDLSDATKLTGASVEHVASMLHGLEYIALSRCYHVMPSTLPLLAHTPTLLALDVFGMLKECAVQHLRDILSNIEVNKFPFSSVARPTTGIRRTSIWGLRVRDSNV